MNVDEVIKVLREYNKWRRGKGRKYQTPGYPFDSAVIGSAIDHAARYLSYYMNAGEFLRLTHTANAAPAELKRANATVLKKAKSICKRIERRIAKMNNDQ